MFLTRPCHSKEFMEKYECYVETHVFSTELQPDYKQYEPYIFGVHLPYRNMNLAAIDEEWRRKSVEYIKSAIDFAAENYSAEHYVMHPTGYEVYRDKIIGYYEYLIPSLIEIADHAAKLNKIICLENQVIWAPNIERSFGYCAAEWYRIQRDVDHPNVMLTLDSSHAATSVAIYDDLADRQKHIFDFLAHPELIKRVHWSDSVLKDNTSKYNDMHLVPGRGDLPREFHQALNELPCLKTLEQSVSDEEHIFSFEYIASL